MIKLYKQMEKILKSIEDIDKRKIPDLFNDYRSSNEEIEEYTNKAERELIEEIKLTRGMQDKKQLIEELKQLREAEKKQLGENLLKKYEEHIKLKENVYILSKEDAKIIEKVREYYKKEKKVNFTIQENKTQAEPKKTVTEIKVEKWKENLEGGFQAPECTPSIVFANANEYVLKDSSKGIEIKLNLDKDMLSPKKSLEYKRKLFDRFGIIGPENSKKLLEDSINKMDLNLCKLYEEYERITKENLIAEYYLAIDMNSKEKMPTKLQYDETKQKENKQMNFLDILRFKNMVKFQEKMGFANVKREPKVSIFKKISLALAAIGSVAALGVGAAKLSNLLEASNMNKVFENEISSNEVPEETKKETIDKLNNDFMKNIKLASANVGDKITIRPESIGYEKPDDIGKDKLEGKSVTDFSDGERAFYIQKILIKKQDGNYENVKAITEDLIKQEAEGAIKIIYHTVEELEDTSNISMNDKGIYIITNSTTGKGIVCGKGRFVEYGDTLKFNEEKQQDYNTLTGQMER